MHSADSSRNSSFFTKIPLPPLVTPGAVAAGEARGAGLAAPPHRQEKAARAQSGLAARGRRLQTVPSWAAPVH